MDARHLAGKQVGWHNLLLIATSLAICAGCKGTPARHRLPTPDLIVSPHAYTGRLMHADGSLVAPPSYSTNLPILEMP